MTILEKNATPGGRARVFNAEGFKFDMGPSWYWMPDTFESFFNDFGYSASDFYDLRRLDPSYRVYFGEDDHLDLPSGEGHVIDLFESIDPGSGMKLKKFLDEAQYKYRVGMNEFVEKPSHSLLEFIDPRIARSALKLNMFSSISAHVEKITQNEKLRQILEFPVLFLGAKPSKTPALYSLMNYADISLGTWYPMGGMHEIVKAMVKVAESQGVTIKYNSEVEEVQFSGKRIKALNGQNWSHTTDGLIAACDYEHFEQHILPTSKRKYDTSYWDSRTLAPSCLLYYVGVNKRLKNLKHHNLFFDSDFEHHSREIYDNPDWPKDPLFYVCAPSVTDSSVAPESCENLFILIPVATGMKENTKVQDEYFELVMTRLEKLTGQEIRPHVIYKRAYGHSNFVEDYHSFKGNAYGLANTLKQTAFLKPKMKNPNIPNMMFAGQLTTPGPGVPPSIISGRVSAKELQKHL